MLYNLRTLFEYLHCECGAYTSNDNSINFVCVNGRESCMTSVRLKPALKSSWIGSYRLPNEYLRSAALDVCSLYRVLLATSPQWVPCLLHALRSGSEPSAPQRAHDDKPHQLQCYWVVRMTQWIAIGLKAITSSVSAGSGQEVFFAIIVGKS